MGKQQRTAVRMGSGVWIPLLLLTDWPLIKLLNLSVCLTCMGGEQLFFPQWHTVGTKGVNTGKESWTKKKRVLDRGWHLESARPYLYFHPLSVALRELTSEEPGWKGGPKIGITHHSFHNKENSLQSSLFFRMLYNQSWTDSWKRSSWDLPRTSLPAELPGKTDRQSQFLKGQWTNTDIWKSPTMVPECVIQGLSVSSCSPGHFWRQSPAGQKGISHQMARWRWFPAQNGHCHIAGTKVSQSMGGCHLIQKMTDRTWQDAQTVHARWFVVLHKDDRFSRTLSPGTLAIWGCSGASEQKGPGAGSLLFGLGWCQSPPPYAVCYYQCLIIQTWV